VNLSGFDREKVELALRRLNPNLLLGFGGKGGGSSFHDPVPVLPVLFLVAAGVPSDNVCNSYFCLIYLSMAESTMSASTGISALTPLGFHLALLWTLPTFFMLST